MQAVLLVCLDVTPADRGWGLAQADPEADVLTNFAGTMTYQQLIAGDRHLARSLGGGTDISP